MTAATEDHHSSTLDNVHILLGEFPVYTMDGRSKGSILSWIESDLNDSTPDTVLVGIRLRPGFSGGMKRFERCAAEADWAVEESIAVFPNLESARFCLPFDDVDSHRFLIREILYARRYSLASRTRFMLGLYRLLVSVIPRPTFLYQSVFVRMRRV